MSKNKLLIWGILVLALVGVLDQTAYTYHLYFYFRWLDAPMHLLGGLSIGFFAAYAFYCYLQKNNLPIPSVRQVFLATLVPVLFIGIVWELFEFGADRFTASKIRLRTIQKFENKWTDNISDLAFDVLGGVFAGTILVRMNKKKNNV